MYFNYFIFSSSRLKTGQVRGKKKAQCDLAETSFVWIARIISIAMNIVVRFKCWFWALTNPSAFLVGLSIWSRVGGWAVPAHLAGRPSRRLRFKSLSRVERNFVTCLFGGLLPFVSSGQHFIFDSGGGDMSNQMIRNPDGPWWVLRKKHKQNLSCKLDRENQIFFFFFFFFFCSFFIF